METDYKRSPTQTPTKKLKSGFSIFSSQEIGSSLVSFQMIFEALQSELFHSLSSKNLKIPLDILISEIQIRILRGGHISRDVFGILGLVFCQQYLSTEDTFESKIMKETVKERLNQTRKSGL